jgi:hypothetical protein
MMIESGYITAHIDDMIREYPHKALLCYVLGNLQLYIKDVERIQTDKNKEYDYINQLTCLKREGMS